MAAIFIDVQAGTGAAKQAFADLADAIRETTTAGDGAGESQKTLAQKIAGMKEQQIAATDAVVRAQRALAEHNATVQAHGKDSREPADSLARHKAAQAEAARQSAAAEKALAGVATETAQAVREADKLTPALARTVKELKATESQADRAASEVRKLELAIVSAAKGASSAGGMLDIFKGNLGANAVSFLSGKLAEAGMHALESAANFERLKTALATTLGSAEAASEVFSDLQRFAAATPFGLEETTEAFIKLKNRGLDASQESLRALGNMASAMGKTLDDAVEMLADVTVGEGERAKEFGIVQEKMGDKVRITFRGMAKEVAFSAQEIQKHYIDIANANFAGGMEAQSKTLGGMWSTMKDGFDQFTVSVMDSGITDSLKSTMETLSGMDDTGRVLSDTLGFLLGGSFQVLSTATSTLLTAIEALFWGIDKLLVPLRLVKESAAGVADMFAEETAKAVKEYEKQLQEAESVRQRYDEAIYQSRAREMNGLVDAMHDLIKLSGEYAVALTAEGLAQLEVADAIGQRNRAEEGLWAKLEERNRKVEEKAAEDAFFRENEMGPALPPGFHDRKKGGRAKKNSGFLDPSDVTIQRSHDGVAESEGLADQAQLLREERAAAQEQELMESRLMRLDREREAIEARGAAELERVDTIFEVQSIESEAWQAREALIDEQLRREHELASWHARNGRTEADRARGQTRLEEVEHARRLRNFEKSVREEQKLNEQRQKQLSLVQGAMGELFSMGADIAVSAVRGEKIALAEMISDYLAAVAKRNAIAAVEQAALAIAAAASYNYPKAAAHGAAAGAHAGVAIAAGVGVRIASGIASDNAKSVAESSATRGGGSGGGGGGKGGGGSGGDDGLEQQQVPVSHEQLRRDTATGAPTGHYSIQIINPTIVGAGGAQELALTIQRELQRLNRKGGRI